MTVTHGGSNKNYTLARYGNLDGDGTNFIGDGNGLLYFNATYNGSYNLSRSSVYANKTITFDCGMGREDTWKTLFSIGFNAYNNYSRFVVIGDSTNNKCLVRYESNINDKTTGTDSSGKTYSTGTYWNSYQLFTATPNATFKVAITFASDRRMYTYFNGTYCGPAGGFEPGIVFNDDVGAWTRMSFFGVPSITAGSGTVSGYRTDSSAQPKSAYISNIKLFNKALSASEVKSYYDTGTVVTSYNISYNNGDYGSGTAPSSTTKAYGASLTLPSSSSITRTGYSQTGWSKKSNGSTKDFDMGASYTTNDDVTLYPYWSATALTFSPGSATLTFSTSSQSCSAFTAASCSTGGTIAYTIQDGNTNSYFSINSSTRVITAAANTPAGIYNLTLRATNGASSATKDATYTVTINKKAVSITAPTAKSLTYNGSSQALVNAGSGEGTSFTYCLTSEGTYTSAIPTGTTAGNYTVYWRANLNTTNYSTASSTTGSVAVTINKKATTITAPTAKSLTYNGSSQALVNAGSGEGTSFTYCLTSGGTYTSAIPTGIGAGTYTVYWKSNLDTTNYSTSNATSGSVVVTIGTRTTDTISFASNAVTKALTDSDFTNELTNTGDGMVTYSSSDSSIASVNPSTGLVSIVSCPSACATVKVYATVTDTSNCDYAVNSIYFTLTITKVPTSDGHLMIKLNSAWTTGSAKTAIHLWGDSGDYYSKILDSSNYLSTSDCYLVPIPDGSWAHAQAVRINSACPINEESYTSNPYGDYIWNWSSNIDFNTNYNWYEMNAWGEYGTESGKMTWKNETSKPCVVGGESLYLDLSSFSSWEWDSLPLKVHLWDGMGSVTVADGTLTRVEGFDIGGGGEYHLYEYRIPEGQAYQSAKFYRGNYNNQTQDLSIVAYKNVCKITGWDWGTFDWNVSDTERAEFFGVYFLSQTGEQCTEYDTNTSESFDTIWTNTSTQYGNMSNAAQKIFETCDSNPSELASKYSQAAARYDYIVNKYSITNYASRAVTAGGLRGFSLGMLINGYSQENDRSAAIIIITSSIAILSITSLAAIYVVKRKRNEK